MLRVNPVLCARCISVKIGFCASLNVAAIEQIAGVARMHRFKKSQTITQDEDAPIAPLILRSGMIKVSHTLADGRQQIIDFLTAGDVLIHQTASNAVLASVEATTDVIACEISLSDLESACTASPDHGHPLLLAVLGEIERKNQQVMMLGRKRSDERIASFLLDFSDRAVRRGEPAEHLNLPMSRAEIADYLSLTTETVSRAFSLLREEGIIQLPKPHEVVICDLAGLLEVAGGGANLSVR